MIEIKTSWNGIEGFAHVSGHPTLDGRSVAQAVSRMVAHLAMYPDNVGKRWRDDNGASGIIGQKLRKRPPAAKPYELPQLDLEGGRMATSYRNMKD